MIPVRLKLRNFLSYRECEIDFSSVHTAVLCGKNGDGKSALLDAMTWAIWDRARGSLADERIHTAANETMVEFEFEAQGRRLVVIRRRTRGKSTGRGPGRAGGVGSVELYEVTEMGRASRSGGTMTETDAAITEAVRMDYDTFAASAFVAQGRADEFTRKAPKERKEVFRKVLGLELYEELAQAAGERKRDATAALKAMGAAMGEAEEQLAGLPAIEAELVALAGERTALAGIVAEAEGGVDGLRQAAAGFHHLQEAAASAADRAGRARRDEAEAAATLDRVRHALEQATDLLANADTVEATYEQLTAVRVAEASMAASQARAVSLDRDAAEARSAVAEERARLESGCAAIAREVEAWERAAAAEEGLVRSIEGLKGDADEISALQATVDAARDEVAALGAQASGAQAEAEQHRQQAAALKEREAQLEDGSATCPVCRQPLAPGDLEHVRQEYAAERKQLGERYRAALAHKAECDELAASLKGDAERTQGECQRRQKALDEQRRAFDVQIAAAREAAAQLPGSRQALAESRAVLANEGFAPGARERLARVLAERATIEYDEEAHRACRAEAAELAHFEASYTAMVTARAQAKSLSERLGEADTALAARSMEVAEAVAALAEATTALQDGTDVGPELQRREAELAAARNREAELARAQGRAEATREGLLQIAERVDLAREQTRAYRDEEQTYGDLSKAFGRDGVQAMLIDQAIPRVEVFANAMLERMTGGRISVALATQKQSARGTLQETLDIQIHDEVGARSYEMYSGGEMFRVDFALRIALARVLAERSGADLPTLIIDEGFGSQDAEGVDRLVEAINAISVDFRMILLVTHVDELRERFERRIEVTKDPVRGSLARVV